ncbi:MAG TPA: UDP-N-acetylmuramoyl-L-alanine--D-glutamate ligase [Nitrospiria bacterium]
MKEQPILVVGAGRSGVSICRVLTRMGAKVTLTDHQPHPVDPFIFEELSQKGVRLELGGHSMDTFLQAKRIILSPGVPPTLSPLLRAKEKGIPVCGEVEFASSFLNGQWVAVTGTNGKSTTTSLIGELLKRRWGSVFVGGNLGKPLSEAVLEKRMWDALVVELSSFQLETIQQFHPFIGVLLNVTPDHMDRYSHFKDYFSAKGRLFKNMNSGDWVVANGDDPVVADLAGRTPCSVAYFHFDQIPSRGVYCQGGEIFSTLHGESRKILNTKDLQLLGKHNFQNVMASIAVGEILNCPEEEIRQAMIQFRGLPHRMERVREINGICFINDSKGTNMGALKISLESFSSPVILIAGGKDKGGEFDSVNPLVGEKVRVCFLIGEAAPRMEKAWGKQTECQRVSDLGDAVKRAWKTARPGDVILFSPGCSSFDMFRDFEERGQVFKEWVWKL